MKGKKLGGLLPAVEENGPEVTDVSDEDEAAEMEDEAVRSQVQQKPKEDKLKLVPELSDMVIYCKSVHFGGFSGPGTSGQAFYEMASFSEGRALRLLQESGEPLSLRPTILAIWNRTGPALWPCRVPTWHSLLYVQTELVGWVGVSLAHQVLH